MVLNCEDEIVNGSTNPNSSNELEIKYEAHFGEGRRKLLLKNIQKNLEYLNLLGLEEIDQIVSRRLRRLNH
jgi:hypothetical protein